MSIYSKSVSIRKKQAPDPIEYDPSYTQGIKYPPRDVGKTFWIDVHDLKVSCLADPVI